MDVLRGYARGVARFLDRRVIWPAAEYAIGASLSGLRFAGESFVRRCPRPVRRSLRRILLGASNAFNRRIVLDPFGQLAEVFLTAAVRARDDPDARQQGEDLNVFFHLGHDWFARNNLGFGSEDDNANCFFPRDLATGPQDLVPPMTNRTNLNIAKTCCLISILSYRPDEEIRACMTADPPMLPNTSFFSVHTDQEGDMGVFVGHDMKWAVFCFRGTEFETGRDWLTSALLNPATGFQIGEDDGTGHMRQTRVRDRYFKQMKYAVNGDFNLEKVVTDPYHDVFPDDACVSALQLALYLHKHGDCKIYCTGHSLGGGMATLLGAYLVAYGLDPAAIVSFGSPPVGDDAFCEWFNGAVPVSWRFVNEDEFAPMAPPIPFTEIGPVEEQELVHVRGLIRAENMNVVDPDAGRPTPPEMEQRIFQLCQEGNPSKMLLDHNLGVTLRRLQEFQPALGSPPVRARTMYAGRFSLAMLPYNLTEV